MKKLALLAAAAALAGAVSAQSPSAPKSGFRAEFLGQLDDVEKKIEGLAAAVPDSKYAWRPAEGVRSISEVYMHVAGANFHFMKFVGAKPPEGLDPAMEKTITDKAKIAEWLKKSFDHVRQTVLAMPDADLEKPTKMFGQDATFRNVLLTEGFHLHEHLGQSIAYARMNGVVPPWTEERMKKAAEKAKEGPEKKK